MTVDMLMQRILNAYQQAKQEGVSDMALAEQAGVAQYTVSRLRNGHSNLTIKSLRGLEYALRGYLGDNE